MHLDLTEEETFTLLNLLTETIENDRYPLSRCGPPGADPLGGRYSQRRTRER